VDIDKRVTVKVLLDSRAMKIFIDKKTKKKYGFRLQKLESLLVVRNVDRIGNSGRNIMH